MTHFAWGANISHGVRNFRRPCEKFRIPSTVLHPQSHFAHYAKLKRRVQKWKVTCHFFLNERSLHWDVLRGKELPLLRYLAIPYLKPRRPRAFHLPRMERPLVLPHLLLSADTRWGDHLLPQGQLLRAPRVQYDAFRPRQPGLQAWASHLKLLSIW